ncbi:MAG: proline dehydrogenase family protein [Phycisphaerales bacterium]|jgi:RHH-type proline utilization regulon transcriptional repressor/proline dehydrogenase/delta 1-pyrroline-5-carboxylate dehydrogenase|nr:proline dehydrogenase family protein [Phycisphaerales bacterium]
MALFKRQSKSTTTTLDPSNHNSVFDAGTEQRILAKGSVLLDHARSKKQSWLSTAFWSDKLMDWAMQDEAFKIQLFRFVDTFPMLVTPEQVHEHLIDYLTQPDVKLPPGLGMGLKAGGMMQGTMTKTVTNQITKMAERFIAGTNATSALPSLEKIWNEGVAFSVDLLGEACVSDAEALEYRQRYLDLLTNLPQSVSSWKPQPVLENDHLGPIPRTNISIKISSLFANTDPIAHDQSIDGLFEALKPILEEAGRNGTLINFDMEQFEYKDLTLDLFMRCCDEIDFPAGLAMQSYLRSGDDDAKRIIEWSKRTDRPVTVRLVKGAYWDYETIHAEEMGWPVPVWSRKIDTDACFERMAALFIDSTPKVSGEGGVKLALGSHNIRSIATAMALLEKRDLPPAALELQMLRGMADQLKAGVLAEGLRLREYVPVGEMIPGMAYLVRRLLENTSNESWLRSSFVDDADATVLLASPHVQHESIDPGVARIQEAPERHHLSPAVTGVGDGRPFFTESYRDFADAETRANFSKAIHASVVPDIRRVETVEEMSEIVTRAQAAFPSWRDTDPLIRSNVLVKAADLMRSRRDELCGVVMKEAGKTWREADGEVCEAIDFCEYYARMAPELFERDRIGQFIGELDQQFYQPCGVAAVISPWNFPMAICCGMTVAALVTGNSVIVKPAGQTVGIAQSICKMLWEAGAPREVLQYAAGPGSVVGAALVRDPRVSIIAFTGSKAVGLDILESAGRTPEDQPFVKKVVCEMGGKNAVIIDASADLDEAVLGVRQSAFGYQGQKCSACSRAIVVDSAHDVFLERLIESTRTLVVGDVMEPGSDMGPVIDAKAAAEIRSYIEIGKSEGTLELAVEVPSGLDERTGRDYIGPHIFSGIEKHHRIAQEEIFGPVLAVMRVNDFDEALKVANASEYKLTGGVYSRKPAHLERARREFRVGNLYLNRGCTGALVARMPFGGFGMSGVGSKAGGKDYLLQFVEPRAICENTMRRGFAPGL